MANEILATLELKLLNIAGKPTRVVTNPKTEASGLKLDQTEKTSYANTQTVAFAAHVALLKGSVTNVGVCYFRNLDATNFVEIGIDVAATFHPTAKIKPGEEWVFRFSGNAPFAQADTGNVKLYYEIFGD